MTYEGIFDKGRVVKVLKDRLRELRTSAGLNQKQCAELLGVAYDNYNKWENGIEPGYAQVIKIAKHYGVTVDYLVGNAPDGTCVEFCKRMKDARGALGASQEDVASAVGITRLSVGNYERGERTPDILVLAKIATHFNVSTDYLLGRTNNPFPTESDAANKVQELQAENNALRKLISNIRGLLDEGHPRSK